MVGGPDTKAAPPRAKPTSGPFPGGSSASSSDGAHGAASPSGQASARVSCSWCPLNETTPTAPASAARLAKAGNIETKATAFTPSTPVATSANAKVSSNAASEPPSYTLITSRLSGVPGAAAAAQSNVVASNVPAARPRAGALTLEYEPAAAARERGAADEQARRVRRRELSTANHNLVRARVAVDGYGQLRRGRQQRRQPHQ